MRCRRNIICASCALGFSLAHGETLAQSATRELPESFVPPGASMPVSITFSVPGGTVAVGVEDRPPAGWPVSNISHSGSLDAQSGKVKWGPFFAPAVPAVVSYDVVPASGSGSSNCFVGTASFDGLNEPITGDACILAIPAASFWTLCCLGVLLAIAATLRLGHTELRVPADCVQPAH